MIAFQVDDMTCGHCVSTITKSVRAIDSGARVTVDLARHLVLIEPTQATEQTLGDAIAAAGYTPSPVTAVTVVAAPDAKSGCCGCCH